MVFGEECRTYSSRSIQTSEIIGVNLQPKSVRRVVLSFGVVYCILKIYIGVDMSGSWGSEWYGGRVVLECLRREGRRDGVGRSRQSRRLLASRKGPCGYGSKGISTSPESGIVGFGNVDRGGLTGQGQGDARDVVGGGHFNDNANWIISLDRGTERVSQSWILMG